ncbi:MAG: hypothetical protein IT289_01725 [Oligoflexia bacterium]|nr:hypothetical protein [Oligoflexia bacterium]
MKKLILLTAAIVFSACSSQPILPEADSIKVGRSKPSSDCTEIGVVRGTTITAKGSAEEALQDMKDEAAKKGATYVLVDQYSGQATAVKGIAYKCP